MVHCLRQKTEEELLEVSLKLNPFTEDLDGDPREENPSLSTVVDGVVLPRTPEEILAEKNFNIVPYVVGINKQEFGWIIPMMMEDPFSKGKMDQKMPRSLLWKFHSLLNISENMIPVATEKYLGGTDDPVKHKNLLLDLFGDVMLGDHVRGLRDGAPKEEVNLSKMVMKF